jgi:CoA:oxalate CoA-transferase
MARKQALGMKLEEGGHLVHGLPTLLNDFTLEARGSELSVETCARRLAMLGAVPERTEVTDNQPQLRLASKWNGVHSGRDELFCKIRWGSEKQDERTTPRTESLVQAITGLMEVHGRDSGKPRRLGLDIASVAAGVFASQGLLAALIARKRGNPIRAVETSVVHSALFFLCQHLGIATCGREFPFRSQESAPGPPFRTADGQWVELEILDVNVWIAFWTQIGVPQALLEKAWPSYLFRYLAGRCKLPEDLQNATSRHTFAELRNVAQTHGVALCRLRNYQEILNGAGSGGAGKWPSQGFMEMPWKIQQGRSEASDYFPESSEAIAGAGPLAGLRVVEVTSRLQGPLASLLLSMLGADVIKVEPQGGDIGRAAPSGPLRAGYTAFNRGKRVVEINYKSREGRAELLQLVRGADVFLHNWRVGRAEQLDLCFEALGRDNSRLIYAHASGWGKNGSEPSPIAGDFLVQAHAGCGEGLNPQDEPPFPSRLVIVDVLGGLLACEGILIGLYLRECTGRAASVDTSLLGAAMTLQDSVLRGIAAGTERNRKLGRPTWGLLDRPMATEDGYLMLDFDGAPVERRLAEVFGVEWVSDETQLGQKIVENMVNRSSVEWVQRLQNAGIAAEVVCTDLATLPSDSRIKALLEQSSTAWFPRSPWQFTS